jgi:predicted metal-dependent hydrolase
MQVAPGCLQRRIVMVLNTRGLSIEILDRMIYMLWKDGLLFKTETWSGGWRFLFGKGGFLHGTGADYRAWYRRDFHPNDLDDRRLIELNVAPIEAEIWT